MGITTKLVVGFTLLVLCKAVTQVPKTAFPSLVQGLRALGGACGYFWEVCCL